MDEHNRELAFEIDEWNASGESLVWVQVWTSTKGNRAYWGIREQHLQHTIWNGYEAVWHLADLLDSSASDNNLSSSGSPSIVSSSSSSVLNGWKFVLQGLGIPRIGVIIPVQSVSGSRLRKLTPTLGWGETRNLWIGLECTGAIRGDGDGWAKDSQGTLSDRQWHHLLVTYPGDGNLSSTAIFWMVNGSTFLLRSMAPLYNHKFYAVESGSLEFRSKQMTDGWMRSGFHNPERLLMGKIFH